MSAPVIAGVVFVGLLLMAAGLALHGGFDPLSAAAWFAAGVAFDIIIRLLIGLPSRGRS